MLVLCKLSCVSATRASISGGIVPVCQRAAEWSDGVRLVYMISMSEPAIIKKQRNPPRTRQLRVVQVQFLEQDQVSDAGRNDALRRWG